MRRYLDTLAWMLAWVVAVSFYPPALAWVDPELADRVSSYVG